MRTVAKVLGMVLTTLGVGGLLLLFAYTGITRDFHPLGMDMPNLLVLSIAWTGLILLVIGEW